MYRSERLGEMSGRTTCFPGAYAVECLRDMRLILALVARSSSNDDDVTVINVPLNMSTPTLVEGTGLTLL